MSLSEKIEKSKDILRNASSFSEEFYNLPLLVIYAYSDRCKALLKLMEDTVDDFGMKITHGKYAFHRMSVSSETGEDDFSVAGKEPHFYSLDHAKEVYQEDKEIGDKNWECLLISAMKANGNVVVYPLREWTDEDIEEYLGK